MEFNNKSTPKNMLKLQHEMILIDDATLILEKVSMFAEVYKICGWYGKRFKRKVVKQVYKDFCKGISLLNKNIPVFVELLKPEKENDATLQQDNSENNTKK